MVVERDGRILSGVSCNSLEATLRDVMKIYHTIIVHVVIVS